MNSIQKIIEEMRHEARIIRGLGVEQTIGIAIGLEQYADRLEALMGEPVAWTDPDGDFYREKPPENWMPIPLYALKGEGE